MDKELLIRKRALHAILVSLHAQTMSVNAEYHELIKAGVIKHCDNTDNDLFEAAMVLVNIIHRCEVDRAETANIELTGKEIIRWWHEKR